MTFALAGQTDGRIAVLTGAAGHRTHLQIHTPTQAHTHPSAVNEAHAVQPASQCRLLVALAPFAAQQKQGMFYILYERADTQL